ncbi:hypothetical protein FA95DRAFT_1560975 [Auriscalpium vulgare]|uniref:Uncharacterized protein n=1 Tax=Auriscalpium vulgare TaxID=40419 RepID=A0ACB8RPJ0_9AGAM|nr:hypothetical protein FA95DRAFT_1560975 [Auriscalpium vulgare]
MSVTSVTSYASDGSTGGPVGQRVQYRLEPNWSATTESFFFDLNGCKRKDVYVNVYNDMLSVRFSQGGIKFSVTLPPDTKKEQVHVEVKDGRCTVKYPKAASGKRTYFL